jgi:vacuolar iron transporter family protein
VTTFATVSGISGANLSTRTILILGFANLVADGLAMGIGDYISSKSEHEFASMERQRELWECEHNIKAEKEEMMELYTKRGMDPTDASRLVGM